MDSPNFNGCRIEYNVRVTCRIMPDSSRYGLLISFRDTPNSEVWDKLSESGVLIKHSKLDGGDSRLYEINDWYDPLKISKETAKWLKSMGCTVWLDISQIS